jgi:hypothetical protein
VLQFLWVSTLKRWKWKFQNHCIAQSHGNLVSNKWNFLIDYELQSAWRTTSMRSLILLSGTNLMRCNHSRAGELGGAGHLASSATAGSDILRACFLSLLNNIGPNCIGAGCAGSALSYAIAADSDCSGGSILIASAPYRCDWGNRRRRSVEDAGGCKLHGAVYAVGGSRTDSQRLDAAGRRRCTAGESDDGSEKKQ